MPSQRGDKLFNGLSGKLGDNIKEKLNVLADELSINYITASFGQKEKGGVKLEALLNKINPPYSLDMPVDHIDIKHRNILVIGGGATHDSYKCIPLGKHITEKLCDNPEKQRLIVERFNENLKEYLPEETKKIAFDKITFEHILSLLTQWYHTPTELRDEITKLVDFRYPPSLFYEIVAHLFKHSFIDAIVNFNFDELLDNAIEEELGNENYYHVLSDGDCVPINDIMIDGRLKIPVYIKPHGTFKHKSSLRFTNRHYLDMPGQIKELLKGLVGGNCGLKSNIRVNLICVGFNMESMEFNEILNKNLAFRSRIFHFTKEKPNEDPRCKPLFLQNVLAEFFENSKKNKPENQTEKDFHDTIYQRIAISSLSKKGRKDGITTPLSEMFSYLWRRVFYEFKESFRPRSIGQHEIISYLFYDPRYGEDSDNKMLVEEERIAKLKTLKKQYRDNNDNRGEAWAYFLDRTIVEIAIAINRNNGIVELAQLLGDRTGKYFGLYKAAKAIYDERNPNKKKETFSIYQLIDQFKNKPTSTAEDFYPKGTFQLETLTLSEIEKNPDDWFRPSNKLDRAFLTIFKEKLMAILSAESQMRNKGAGDFNAIVPMLLYYLFTSKCLSDTFKRNFIANSNKIVYNSKVYKKQETDRMQAVYADEQKGPRMIDELTRLFDKSGVSSVSYFSIHPKFNDPKNFLIESFTKSKVMHTNLALDYKFRSMLLQKEPMDWNLLLIISEKTSLLGFLQEKEYKGTYQLENRKVVIINSYEAIKQFHPEIDSFYNDQLIYCENELKAKSPGLSDKDVEKKAEKKAFELKINELVRLQENKYTTIIDNCTKAPEKGDRCKIEVNCLPAMQHNHHMMVFIKKVQLGEASNKPIYYENKEGGTYRLEMLGALYMYRQGFSNSINPIFIPGADDGENNESVTNDFLRLLRIFSKIHRRAELFKELPESEDLDVDFKYQLNKIV